MLERGSDIVRSRFGCSQLQQFLLPGADLVDGFGPGAPGAGPLVGGGGEQEPGAGRRAGQSASVRTKLGRILDIFRVREVRKSIMKISGL